MNRLQHGQSKDGIGLALSGGVGWIIIDRPAVKNAFDPPAWTALLGAVRGAIDARVRAIVIEGAGDAFSAGGNLKNIEERLALDRETRRVQLLRDSDVIVALRGAPCPTIAVINGPALGAGLALALACDVRICSARSTLAAAFRRVGLAGDFGISWLLPRLIGRGRALDLLYTGRVVAADEALRMGLVERVFADAEFTAEAERYVAAIADGPASLATIRRAVDAVAGLPFAEAVGVEASHQADASQTQDAREGVRAFLEKRPPRFTGS